MPRGLVDGQPGGRGEGDQGAFREVALWRARKSRPNRPRPADLPETISLQPVVDDIVLLDPVCGMTVDGAHARHLAEHDGVVYAFCSIGCRTRFIKEPASFLAAPGTASMDPSSPVSLPD